jgi:hypothetical protein
MVRTLDKLPEYLKGAPTDRGFKVLEMGALESYRQFMDDNREFKNAKYLSSMAVEHNESRRGFSGAQSYTVFQDLLQNGDDDVIKSIKTATKQNIKELQKTYEKELVGYKFDVSGKFFDIGLVLSGVPEHWLEEEYQEQGKVMVEILINGTFPSKTNKEDVIKNSAKILAMTQILEDNDVLVKIKIVSCIKEYGGKEKYLYIATDVKDYDEPINYKKCSALLSPTYLRRGAFKIMEIEAGFSLSGDYGRPVDVPQLIQINNDDAVRRLETKLFKRG